MNLELTENIEDNLISAINSSDITKENDIIFFGANKSSLTMMEILKDYHFLAIIDNDKRKQGQLISGLKVYSPDELLADYNPNYRILIASEYYAAMRKQLETFGYKEGKEILILWHGNRYYSIDDETFNYHASKVRYGEEVYNEFRKDAPSDFIFICPYAGTGDMYLVGMYLEEYMKTHEITGYSVIVPNNNCKRILGLFDLKAISMEYAKIECLMMFCRMRGFDSTHSKVLNDGFNQIMVKRLRGYKNIDFNTMFRQGVFEIKGDYNYIFKQENADDIFTDNSLRKGRTVLLSPYANTITKISDDFWIKLAKELKALDYDVVTNVSGDEESIEGTMGLFVPYKQIISFLDDAGYFVGVRSGLCDIICSSRAKMAVLYPFGNVFGACSTYDYFSLEKMDLKTDNLLEIIYEKTDLSDNIDNLNKIVDFCNII
ncbi:MAG: hypothetical protein K5656_08295 [Lachnospiraceae bacterium]|nr:hypothetical protein [Lachnospiraceae bacterium]